MTWQNLEEKVRTIASLRWNCVAVSETIAGVKCDCILKIAEDNWIVIEITKQNDLTKVREDIVKLRTVKNALLLDDIYCKCYFVMEDKPTDSMRASGLAQTVTVMSLIEFQN